MDREVFRVWKLFDRCRTRKCSKIIKDIEKEKKIFEKKMKKCPQKNIEAWADCHTRFYKASKLEKLSKDEEKCSNNKCYTQKKNLIVIKKLSKGIEKCSNNKCYTQKKKLNTYRNKQYQ
jgi:hypothetical protein